MRMAGKEFSNLTKNTLGGENLFHAFHGRYLSICYYCKGSCQSDKPLPNTTNSYISKFLPRSSIFLTKISELSNVVRRKFQDCHIVTSFGLIRISGSGSWECTVQDPADNIDWLLGKHCTVNKARKNSHWNIKLRFGLL